MVVNSPEDLECSFIYIDISGTNCANIFMFTPSFASICRLLAIKGR